MKSVIRLCSQFLSIAMLSFFAVSGTLAAESEWIYTVHSGDTLTNIANRYLTTTSDWEKLQQLNRVPDPRHLQPDSKLRIPVAWLRREAAVADVLRIQGDAQRIPASNQSTIKIESGMQLHVGDTIKTSTDTSLTLRFVDGSRLLVAANSKLTLTSLLAYSKTGMADTQLKLHEGSVETQVAPQMGSAAKYEVKAPTLHLGVRGTDFRVRVDPTTGATLSEVLKGRVAASAERHEVTLNPGFGTLAQIGKPPLAPKALLHAPDTSTTATLLERVPLRFQWQAVAGAQTYRAQVFADHSFDRIVLDDTFPANSAKWVDLPDGKYVLRVRAIDSNGLEGINADHDFTLKARPESPFINSPANGAKVYGEVAVLSWVQSSIAHAYHVQVSVSNDFSTPFADQSNITATEYTQALQPGQYFWRIASVLADGDQGPYSDPLSFTQRKMPASPEVEPPKIGGKELSFHWNAGSNGEKYQFQFAKDKEFKSPLLDTLTAESQISLPTPNPGSYFMRVKTIDTDGFAGPFGQTQLIKIPAPFPWWMIIPALAL